MAGPDTRKGGVGSVVLVNDFRLHNFEIRHRTTRDLNVQVFLLWGKGVDLRLARVGLYEKTERVG